MRLRLHIRRLSRLVRPALVLAACTLATAHPVEAQEAVTATSGEPGVIARIRALFAEVEREASTYRRATRDLQGFSLEGGELVGFYRGSELRKLAAHHYGETGAATEAYYFSDGRPMFIHIVDVTYDEPLSGRVRYRTEDRYYFDGGRLIRHVHTPDPKQDDDEETGPSDPPAPEFLLKVAEQFAACAASTGAEPPQCTAPDR